MERLQLMKVKQELPSHIDLVKTENLYGYDPQYLKLNSCKLVVCYCTECNKEQQKKLRLAIRNVLCIGCSNKINANTNKNIRSQKVKQFWELNNHPMLGKHHTAESIQMMSDNRKGKCVGKDNPSYGKISNHGKGEWISTSTGNVYVRSSYEKAYLLYLENNKIRYTFEPTKFPIKYIYNGKEKEGTYTPDFYLIDENKYIEIKGWWRGDAKSKFEAFVEQYMFKTEVLDRNKLRSLNLKIR